MAQVTAYIPDDLEARMKERAKEAGESVSAYLTQLVRSDIESKERAYSPEFWALFGAWSGAFPEVDLLPPDPEVEF
jgi:hypothetical protein